MSPTAAPADRPFDHAVDTWNRRYQAEGYLFGTAPNVWLREHAGVWSAGQRVLCVADGDGRNSVWLARQGLRVEAFDLSDVAVAKARVLAAQAGVAVDFAVADCEGYAWPQGTLDGIAAIFIQFADPQVRARLFARMVDALAPGGVLVLQGYTPAQLQHKTGGPDRLSHLYTEALLREAFAALDIEVLRDYEADVIEGAGHRGRSALIGLVARKR
jgi:SAM-dependent methyltransferase